MRAGAGPPVRVEVIVLSVRARQLRYRSEMVGLNAGDVPDDVAASLSALEDPGGLLHSTSWRYVDGEVVLTYAALPDPKPRKRSRPIGAAKVVSSGDPQEPDPQATLDEVAAHAVRHLAFLNETDQTVAQALTAHEAMLRILSSFRPAVAGQAIESSVR